MALHHFTSHSSVKIHGIFSLILVVQHHSFPQTTLRGDQSIHQPYKTHAHPLFYDT